MKLLSKVIIRGVLPLAAAAAMVAAGGCRDTDDGLGLGLISQGQRMTMGDTTLYGFADTYMAHTDSVSYGNLGLIYLGRMSDPVFGRTAGSGVLQFYPTDFDDPDDQGYFGFGLDPIVDSAALVLSIEAFSDGDPQVEQRFNVYPMTELLKPDSVYFCNMDMTGLYGADPLFSFTLKDIGGAAMLRVPLVPTAGGLEYLQSLVDAPQELYDDTTAYRNRFKGLYIAPAPDSPEAARIYTVRLYSQATGYIASALNIHARNHDQDGSVLDTIVHTYHFTDHKIGFNQLSVARLERDYTGTPLENMQYAAFDSLPPAGAVRQSQLYFQSGSGVFPYIHITDRLLAAVEGIKEQHGDDHDLIVDRALISFPLTDPTVDKMSAAPPRLGLYHHYGARYQGVADYDFYGEYTTGNTLPYGGGLDKYYRRYTMNITSYVTRLLRSAEPGSRVSVRRTMALGSDFYTMMGTMRQVELLGEGAAPDPERRIRLQLTYTLIPKLK